MELISRFLGLDLCEARGVNSGRFIPIYLAMKTGCSQGQRRRGVFGGLLLFAALGAASGQLSQPTITSIARQGTDIVVSASVPTGLCRLTLECRQRLGAGSWEPRAVSRLDGNSSSISFRLPLSRQTELMRVRGDATEPLPASFYTGTNSFLGQPGSSAGPGGVGLLDGGPSPGTAPGDSTPPDPSREVVESDIWKIREPNGPAGAARPSETGG